MFYLGLNEKVENYLLSHQKRMKIKADMNISYNTSLGYEVVRHGDSFLVKEKNRKGRFIDLKSNIHSWEPLSAHFQDCIGSREEVESRFGTIILPNTTWDE